MKNPSITTALALALLGAWAPLARAAVAPPERQFLWEEANALMSAARGQDDYLRAARHYQQVVEAGARNAAVFYNLGTALLRAERYDDALTALTRAERYAGYADDIAQNMAIARARRAGQGAADEPWYRLVFFWHFRLASSVRATVAGATFSVFWLALAAYRLGLRRVGRPIAAAALLGCLLFGSSVAVTWHQEATARKPLLFLAPPAANETLDLKQS